MKHHDILLTLPTNFLPRHQSQPGSKSIEPIRMFKIKFHKTKPLYDRRIIARIGRGKHQKSWKQEIWQEHNSNLLQRHSHVYICSFPRYLVVFQGHPIAICHIGGS